MFAALVSSGSDQHSNTRPKIAIHSTQAWMVDHDVHHVRIRTSQERGVHNMGSEVPSGELGGDTHLSRHDGCMASSTRQYDHTTSAQ